MSKRICVLSGSRTGSTLMQIILWRYVARKWGYHSPLGDLMIRAWPYDTGWCVRTMRLSHLTPHEAWTLPIDRTFEYNRRIDLLKKYHHHRYFVKMPSYFWLHCDQEHLDYLYENYHFIVTDRRDKRDRALSYAVAMISNWFTVRHKEQIENFVAGEFTEELGDMILYDFKALETAKEVLANTPGVDYNVVWYEDVAALEDKFEVLGQLGFSDWERYVRPLDRNRLPYKIGHMIDKESHVTNIEFFNEWFAKHFPDESAD